MTGSPIIPAPPLTAFRTLALMVGDNGSPEVFTVAAVVNTERGIEAKANTTDVYRPDPANPEKPLPRTVNVTGYSYSISVSGTCDSGSLAGLQTWFESGLGHNVKLVALTPVTGTPLGHYAGSAKLTGFSAKADPVKGEDATFDGTLEIDGAFPWTAGS